MRWLVRQKCGPFSLHRRVLHNTAHWMGARTVFIDEVDSNSVHSQLLMTFINSSFTYRVTAQNFISFVQIRFISKKWTGTSRRSRLMCHRLSSGIMLHQYKIYFILKFCVVTI